MDETERIEALLAEALAAFDDGGDASLKAFVDAHAADRTRLLRGIERCREMGMLGTSPAAREFPGGHRLVRVPDRVHQVVPVDEERHTRIVAHTAHKSPEPTRRAGWVLESY